MKRTFLATSLLVLIGTLLGLIAGFEAEAQSGGIEDLAWNRDGRLAVAYADGTIQILNASGQLMNTFHIAEGIYTTIDWNPVDGRLLIAANGPVYIVDGTTGQTLHRYDGDTTYLAKWSPDGNRLAGNVGGNISRLPDVAIFDPTTDTILFMLETLGTRSVTALEWSPDGSMIAAGYDRGLIVIWNAATGQELVQWTSGNGIAEDYVSSMAWSPDGSKLVTAPNLFYPQVWNVNTGTQLLSLTMSTEDIAWSPDGTRIAGVDSGNIYTWNAVNGQLLSTISQRGFIHAIAWSPNGNNLAFGGTRSQQIILAPPLPTAALTE